MAGAPDGTPAIALAETCRVVGGDVPLWSLHRARLSEGGCGEQLLEDVERAVAGAIAAYAGEHTSRLRAHLEVQPDGSVTVDVERRLSSLDVVNGPVVVPVRACELPTSPPVLLGCAAKPADRSWWDLAARDARRRGGHQALIVDADGLVVDGSSATVWAVIDGALVTPPAPPAIAGVARRFVIERSRDAGLEVEIRSLELKELEAADEVFLTNGFGGAVAARGRGGEITDAIRAMFSEVWPRDWQPRESASRSPQTAASDRKSR